MNNNIQNIQIVKDYFQATSEYLQATTNKNIDKIMELLTDDVIWNVAGSINVSTTGLLKGKEQVKKWMLGFPENFQPLDFPINDFFS